VAAQSRHGGGAQGPRTRDGDAWRWWAPLAGLAVLAAWLRVAGITFGLPAVYNPDEISILARALAFATGDLNPHNFLYPTFLFYVLFAWIGGAFIALRLTARVASLDAFQTQFFTDPSDIYLAGRLLGVTCGVATVVAIAWLARRLFGTRVALGAALFLAVAPAAVRDAHYIKHDVPATLAVVVAMAAIARLWPGAAPRAPSARRADAARAVYRGWNRDLLLSGAACGAAFSTHYYTVFLAVPLGLAAWWRSEGRLLQRRGVDLLLAAGAAAVVFFALSPFLLVEPGTAWRDVLANRQIVVDRSGAGQGSWFPSAISYTRMMWGEALGWPVLLLALAGSVAAWRLSRRMGTWLFVFPVIFLLFISNTVAASRYLNPVLPFLAIAASLGLNDVVARLWPRRHTLVVVALAVGASVPGLLQSWRVGTFFRQTDTRTLAQRFIEEHLPAGTSVLVQPYSVQLVQSRASLVEALTARLGGVDRASTKFALRLALDPWPAPAYRTLFLGEGGLDADKIYVGYGELADGRATEVFRRLGVEVVVLKRYPVEDPATGPLRAVLEDEGRLLARFTPYRPDAGPARQLMAPPFLHNTDTPLDPVLERPGPIMEIWAVR
jgi:hypothetical protein